MQELQRPGGELATRPIHFFWEWTVQDPCMEKK